MTRLDLAKERLAIPDLAALRGWQWTPGRACRVPYRADKSPSGSVFADGRLMFDHSTGETVDAPAILARVEGLSPQDACRLFIELARIGADEGDKKPPGNFTGENLRNSRGFGGSGIPEPHTPPSTPLPLPAKPALPALQRPLDAHLRAIARIRRLSLAALSMAVSRGLLWTCVHRGFACWAVTDAAGWLCQIRRLDGQPFTRKDGSTFKAWTLPGCRAGWPLGIGEAIAVPSIAICEGGPDMLALLHLALSLGCAERLAPVAMLGASTRIVADALPLFAGKRVRLYPHADEAREDGRTPGLEAAARWQDQLTAAGAVVDVFDLAGITGPDGPCKDLNDLACLPLASITDDPELAGMFEL